MITQYKSTLWIVFLWIASFLAGVFVSKNTCWYNSLVMPRGIPDSGTFAFCWALLYTILTTAGLSLLHQKRLKKVTKKALFLYSLLFIMGLAWLPLSFTLQSLYFAWNWILVTGVIALVVLIHLVRLSVLSGVLLTPYILWLIYATVLTYGCLILNT